MLRRTSIVCLIGIFLAGLSLVGGPALAAERRPNIVYILCDDLGYGDVKCYSDRCKIPTPQMDRLAASGMMFTDAHSGSSVCTPTRYGILTGRYSWRTKMQSGVLGGKSPALIAEDRLTVASLLKGQGYATACIGKWHLGIGKTTTPYGEPMVPGPNACGFDYFFGIPASLDMEPYVYVENEQTVELPTAKIDAATEDMPGKGFWRAGPIAPGFRHIDVLPKLTERATWFIGQQKPERPFFLYLPLASPHTPILPTEPWVGKGVIGDYGDFVAMTDDAIGQVLAALDKAGLADNTLVILTSDNGCAPAANIEAMIAQGHYPSGPLRGHKADIYEGGHRVPFIVRWPGVVAPGSKSSVTICHTDLFATCAEIVGQKTPDNAGEDSASILPALRGGAEPVHEAVVHHSAQGAFAIRQGPWKLCLCPGSGGWSYPKPGKDNTDDLPQVQLFDLSSDLAETKNLVSEQPEVVARLTQLMDRFVTEGRSTPGVAQKNDVPVNVQAANQKKKPKGK